MVGIFLRKIGGFMVLNVTEEQKKLRESEGYMGVGVGWWVRKRGEVLIDYVRGWIDTWKAIVLFLQEKMFKAFDTFEDLAERISMELKPYVEQLEYVNRIEHREYEFVRFTYSKCST